ncbi:MAG: hypothetical protein JWO19_5956 [Bryobacterales bacterium]|nr:hypothetical protein [Bryobacterales bacterium]
MNHSLYSADRQTHRRIIGSAFVVFITMLGAAVMSKFEQQPARSSAAALRAGMPIATIDGGYLIVR